MRRAATRIFGVVMLNFFRTFFTLVLATAVIGAAGLGVHQMLYQKPGLYLWSMVPNGTGGYRFYLTKNEGDPSALADAPEGAEVEKKVVAKPKKRSNKLSDISSQPGKYQLFNGTNLDHWESFKSGRGDVKVNEFGEIEVGVDGIICGLKWMGKALPTQNYEVTFETKRIEGHDYFCALTFPVERDFATLILGGWGGGVVGISSIDGLNGSENETMNIESFQEYQWYQVRLRVADGQIAAWIDERELVNVDVAGREISLGSSDFERCKPLGFAANIGRAAYRNIEWTSF